MTGPRRSRRKLPTALVVQRQRRRAPVYCGPRAVAYILGTTPFDAERKVRLANSHLAGRIIVGLHPAEVTCALEAEGYHAVEEVVKAPRLRAGKWTLGQLAAPLGERGPWLVSVPGHYLIVDKGKVWDKLEQGIPLERSRYRRRRAVAAVRFEKKAVDPRDE